MNNDQINELLALMGQQIKDQAELRETSDRRFAQLTDVMVNGFLRLEDRLGARIDNVSARVDHLTDRVDHLTDRVDHLTEEVREIKAQGQETNRRLGNVFEHTGQLTETTQAAGLRLSHVEEAQQPTNAELDARLRAVEAQLRNAS
ncbi:hypothetical protein ACFQ48_10015 [Hymenobacter caeli]|uniref:Uncharacterized coiled-coil DUF342 family protein n=1 Tax=Hymenobacter caeli TaxID=2735894 RepID=A0ABX2FTL5_9BACT|nr:hypothetical protein [Hymenobacter caeli]NRT19821.1 uncharacterized coiled-coil DUF342 family protein [Hymenobacter caeli]